MKLRTGVKFTDGTPFNADVAAQNLLRFRDGTSANKSYLANVKDAKALNATTLQITLTQPDPALLTYLAQNAGLEESPKAFGTKDEQTNPVGSGPYILNTSQTVVGSKYVYTKNPNYWAPDQQHYSNLVINVYTTTPTQVNAIAGGQVSGLNTIDNSANDQIKSSGYTLYPVELNWAGLLLLDRNGKQAPALAKVQVRQAINDAIDRSAMLKAVAKGYGTVTTQIFAKTSPAFDSSLDSQYPFDPAKAKQLLAAAGYPNGFTLNMPLIPIGSTTVFDLVKQYLGDVGIKVNYTSTSLNDIIDAVLAPKFPATYFTLQMDPTPWQEANFVIAPNATFNPFHTTSPQVNSLLHTIQVGSTSASDAAAKQLNTYVVQQAWFDPWYRVQGQFAANSSTAVVQQSDNAYPYLWNITPKS